MIRIFNSLAFGVAHKIEVDGLAGNDGAERAVFHDDEVVAELGDLEHGLGRERMVGGGVLVSGVDLLIRLSWLGLGLTVGSGWINLSRDRGRREGVRLSVIHSGELLEGSRSSRERLDGLGIHRILLVRLLKLGLKTGRRSGAGGKIRIRLKIILRLHNCYVKYYTRF